MGCFSPSTPKSGSVTKNYLNLVRGFGQGEGTILNTEQQYKPGFVGTAVNAAGQAADPLLGIYGDTAGELAGVQAGANTGQRYSDLNDLFRLGPSAAAAVRGANPGAGNLLDELDRQASLGLQQGTALDPTQVREITDAVRNNWATRGLGTSGPALADEVAQLTGAGQAAQQSRRNFALGVSNADQALTNPALALATSRSDVPGQAQAFTGGILNFANQAGPTLIPGSQSYDIFNTAYNARAAANIAAANNNAAIAGGALSY